MKKTIIFVLILSTLLCLFAGCKEEPVQTQTGDTETYAPREEEISDNLPNKNMEDFELRIHTNNPAKFTWAEVTLAPEDYTGEEIYDEMFERNAYISERFNCEITVTQEATAQISAEKNTNLCNERGQCNGTSGCYALR